MGATERAEDSIPTVPSAAGLSPTTTEAITDGGKEEELSDKEKAARAKQEEKRKLAEFGGAVTFGKLLSLASCGELLVFWVGCLMAAVHGLGQPALCLMFGDLIDATSQPVAFSGVYSNVTAAAAAAPGLGTDAFLDEIGSVALKFIGIGGAVLVAGSFQGFAFGYFVAKQLAKIRPLYYDALLHRDVGWFDTHDAAALPSTMDANLDEYVEGLGTKFGVSIQASSTALGGLVFGFILSWQVSLMMCISIPLLGIGAVIMGQSIMDMMLETQGAYSRAAKIVEEVLFAVRTVVAFGGEFREVERYSSAVNEARRGGVKNRVKVGIGGGYIWMMYFFSLALAFWFGMMLVYQGWEEDISVGKMLAAFFCVLTAGFTLGQVPPGFAGASKAKSSMAMFFYALENDAQIQRRSKDERADIGSIDTLELSNVVFAYPAQPEVTVLNGLSLKISRGQKVAVVGESGSGKSTVMALLERFYDPSSGAVLVNGQDLKGISVKSYRQQIGYVGQEPVVFATSVKENIMQGCSGASEADFREACRMAQLDFVNNLPNKFNTYMGTGGSQFSGGQKQRVAIARALLKKPSVLFLDEATSALDTQSEKMIQETIDTLGAGSSGLTMVTIAHRLSTVHNSDVIFVLSLGAVAEFGTHNELMEKEGGLYRALAAAQKHASQAQSDADVDTAGTQLQRATSGERDPFHRQGSGDSKKGAGQEDHDVAEQARVAEIAKTYKVPMARLLTFARSELPYFAPGLVAALLAGSCFPFLGSVVLIDAMSGFLNPDKEIMREEVESACIWFVIVGLIRAIVQGIQYWCFGVIGEAMTMRMRVALLKKIFEMEIGFHDDPSHAPGKLLKALQLYALRIAGLAVSIGDKADALCSIVVGLTLGFIADWRMSLAMLASIPIFGVAQGIQVAVMMGSSKQESETLKKSAQLVSDSVNSARTVHAAGNEKELVKLFSEMVAPISQGLLKKHLTEGFVFGLANAIVFWVCAGGFWFMGYLISENLTTFDDGMRSFMGILYAGMGAGMAFTLTGDLSKAKVAAHDLFKLLDEPSKINGLENAGDIISQNGNIG
jgi:ABC-type multidrug transport system fused ATPase/permease subunit